MTFPIIKATQMYIKVIEDPRILMLGHLGRSLVDFDVDELLKVCRELGKPVEINEHSFFQNEDITKRCKDIAVRCAELSVMICVNTDAHISTDIGMFEGARQLLSEIDFPEELIMNRDSKTFLEKYYAAGFEEIDFSTGARG